MATQTEPKTQSLVLGNALIKELENGPFAKDLTRAYQLDIECTCNLEELVLHKYFLQDSAKSLQNQEMHDFCEKVRKSLEEVIMVKNNYNQMLVHALFTIQKQDQHLKTQANLLEVQGRKISEQEKEITKLQQMINDQKTSSESIQRSFKRSKSFSQSQTKTHSFKDPGTKSLTSLHTIPNSSENVEIKENHRGSQNQIKEEKKIQQKKINKVEQRKLEKRKLLSQETSQSKNSERPKDPNEGTINCSLDVSCCKENLNSTQPKTRENSTVQTLQDLPKVLEISYQTMNNDKSKEGQGKSLGSDEKAHPQTPLNNKKSLASFEILNERSFSISKGQGSHRTYTENSGLKVSDIIASKDTLNDPLTNKKKLIQLCKEKKNERSFSSGKKKRRSLDVERSQDENKKECQVFLKRQKLDLPKLRRSKSFGNKQMSPNLNNLEALKKKVNCKKVMTKSSSSCLLSTPFLPEESNKKVFKNSEQKLVNKENDEIDVQSHEIHKKNKNNLTIEKSVLKNIINNEKGTLQEEIKENWSYEAVNTRLDSEWDYHMINDGSMNMSLGRISLGKKNSHVKNIEKVYGAKSNPKSKNWAPILSNKN